MATSGGTATGNGLNPEYLKANCPLAWNTPERRDTYAKLGFDMVGEAFRLIQEYLGENEVAPGKLPIRLGMHFSAEAAGGPPIIRVAKRQDPEIEPWAGKTACGPSDDKPALSAQYLDEHMPTAWDDPAMRDAYATLGFMIERDVVHGLIEHPVEGDQATRSVHITVDTTWTAGGCAVVCVNGCCAHQNRR